MDLSYFETVNDDEAVFNRPETKLLADLERVIGLGKPEVVINRFAEMVTLGEQWSWYDDYQEYLLAVISRDELIASHEIEFDEQGVEIQWTQPQKPTEPLRPILLTTDQVLVNAKGYSALLKNRGNELFGHTISLNESNQNGIAAVLTGLNLASETGIDMFPMSFKAETLGEDVAILFNDLAEFKGFALQFMSARQAFFS
jgi:hypothetical protein